MSEDRMGRGEYRSNRLISAIPAIAGAIFAVRAFEFPYLHDDFDFLGRAQRFEWGFLLPDERSLFWRPIPREIYFGSLYHLGGAGPWLGHLVHVCLIALAAWLVGRLTSRLAGPVAGFLAAGLFASFPQLPFLAAWLSGAQDLFAIVFVLLAFNARADGNFVASAVAFTLGLLCKETVAVFAAPLAAFDWIVRRSAARAMRHGATYIGITAVWAALHPGIRAVALGTADANPGEYVGRPAREAAATLLDGLLSLAGAPLPPVRLSPHLLDGVPWLAACGLLLFGLVRARAGEPSAGAGPGASPIPAARVHVLAVTMAALSLGLTGLVARTWFPYYACLAYVGVSMSLGVLLSRASQGLLWLGFSLLLVLNGIAGNRVYRDEIPTIRGMTPAALALRKIESEFKRLTPEIRGDATVYVSVQSKGSSSLFTHLMDLQCLRIWYRNPELSTFEPERWRSAGGAERVFWISPRMEVFEVDLPTLRTRSNGSEPRVEQYAKTLRGLAVGMASGGDVGRAVGILTRLPERDPALGVYNRRLAGALLLATGRDREAASLLADAPSFTPETSLDLILTTLGHFTPELDMDDAVLRAFGFSPTNAPVLRSLMRGFEREVCKEQAVRFARKLTALTPSDPDAARILALWGRSDSGARPTISIPPD